MSNTYSNVEELILADEDIILPYVPDMDDSEEEVTQKVEYVVEKVEPRMAVVNFFSYIFTN